MRSQRSKSLAGLLGAAVLAAGFGWGKPAAASEPFIGQIQYFPYNFAPRFWAFCNGQLLQIVDNTALFSLVGTTFGGDGRITFGLPDMRGRTPVHVGQGGAGPGLSPYAWGQRSGLENVVLSSQQVPDHTHALRGTNNRGTQSSPQGGALARDGRDRTYRAEAPDTDLAAGSVAFSGGGQAHQNMPPYLGLNCNIALVGTFPSRD